MIVPFKFILMHSLRLVVWMFLAVASECMQTISSVSIMQRFNQFFSRVATTVINNNAIIIDQPRYKLIPVYFHTS